MATENQDPYAVLGISPTATQAEIAHAYRVRVRATHPDTRIDSASNPSTADEHLWRILAAYALLRTPDQRANYDRSTAGNTTPRLPSLARQGPVHIPVNRLEPRAPTSPGSRPWLWAGPVRQHL